MSLGTREQLRQLAGNGDLRLLISANLVSQTGDWILTTGVGFQVYVLTGSTVATAGVLLAMQIPQMVLGSVAGTLVDRWDRRRVMIVVDLGLAVALLPLFAVRTADHVWLVYLVMALTSCLTPFFVAAEASLLPALVTRSDGLLTANAANAQARNVARLIGAALGGVLVGTGGLAAIAAADLATFLIGATLLVVIRHRGAPTRRTRTRLIPDWAEGLHAIRGSRDLTVVVAFFALAGVGEGIMGTLFAPFVHDVLGGDGTAFGTILGAQAVGGIVGGVLVTATGHRFSPRVLFGAGALGFGLLDLVLFLYPLVVPGVLPAVVVIALVGLPGAALSAGMLTVFQLATVDRLRGRVFGAATTAQNAAMLLSALTAGTLAAQAGVVAVIAVQGAMYVVGGGLVLLLLRSAPGPETNPAATSHPPSRVAAGSG